MPRTAAKSSPSIIPSEMAFLLKHGFRPDAIVVIANFADSELFPLRKAFSVNVQGPIRVSRHHPAYTGTEYDGFQIMLLSTMTDGVSTIENQPQAHNPRPCMEPRYVAQEDWLLRKTSRKQVKIALFGHFGTGNFGNESTVQAMLCNVRRLMPNAKISCVCSAPEIVTAEYKISAVPISCVVVKSWSLRNPLATIARKLFIRIPSELYRRFKGMTTLWNKDILIVVGTGLLTDASASVAGVPTACSNGRRLPSFAAVD